jgi:hypothetical protein
MYGGNRELLIEGCRGIRLESGLQDDECTLMLNWSTNVIYFGGMAIVLSSPHRLLPTINTRGLIMGQVVVGVGFCQEQAVVCRGGFLRSLKKSRLSPPQQVSNIFTCILSQPQIECR